MPSPSPGSPASGYSSPPPPSRSGSVVLVYHSLPFGAATKPARSFSAQFFLRSGFSRVSGVVSDHCQMVNCNASLLGVKLQFLSNGNLVLCLCHLCNPPLRKACHSPALTFVLVLGVIHSSIHLSRPCSGSDIMAGMRRYWNEKDTDPALKCS